mmetsp:Transcript_66363/g.158776  ORF Transcript_66363/g.158776 Transcript_66363/m.158776 type:complete len:122 (+) Transcript_66363:1187-1552(+)
MVAVSLSALVVHGLSGAERQALAQSCWINGRYSRGSGQSQELRKHSHRQQGCRGLHQLLNNGVRLRLHRILGKAAVRLLTVQPGRSTSCHSCHTWRPKSVVNIWDSLQLDLLEGSFSTGNQ